MKDYSHLSKEEAFRLARKELGVKRQFKYQGVVYSTNTLDDENSKFYNLIPNDEFKYMIDHNKGQVFRWMDNDWQQTKLLDNKLIPINEVDGFLHQKKRAKVPIKFDNTKVTIDDILEGIASTPSLHSVYPDVIEALKQNDKRNAWKFLLAHDGSYEQLTSGDISDPEREIIERGLSLDKNQNPMYDSINPFMWNGQVDMEEFGEYTLSEKNYTPIDKIPDREGGVYYLIQMEDNTEDPNEPQINFDAVENKEILDLMLSMPNNLIDAQAMGLGDKWNKVQEYYEQGYRLLHESGEIKKGFKEEAMWNDIFTVDNTRKKWDMNDAFYEDWHDGGWAELLPWVGGYVQVAGLMNIYESAQKVATAEETGNWDDVTEDDLLLLKQHYEKSLRDYTWGALVYDGAVHIPGFAIELATTRGMTRWGVELTEQGIKKGLKWLSTKAGRELFESKLASMGTKLTSHLAVNSVTRVMNPVGMLGRTWAGAVERQIPLIAVGENNHGDLQAMILQEGMGISEAWGWSFLDTHIEVMSEQFGDWVMGISPQAKEVMGRLAFTQLFQKMNPNLSTKEMQKVMSRFGFHGVGMEMVEEEVGRGVRGIIHTFNDGDKSFEYKLPTWKELSAQFTSFLLNPMAGGITGYNYLANYQNVKIASRVKEFSKRGSKYYQKGFNKRTSVKEVNKAIKNGTIDVNTGNYIKYLLHANKDFDSTSLIEVFKQGEFKFREDYIKKLMDEGGISYASAEEKWKEFLKGEGVSEDALVVQVLGSTRVDELADGYDRVVMSLYGGADKETIVEEFLGVYFKTMPKEDLDAFLKIYEKSGSDLTAQEFFEKNGIGYVLDNTEFGNTTMQKVMNSVKKALVNFMGNANESYELTGNIKNLYDNFMGTSKSVKIDTKIIEVKNVNVNSRDKSYKVVPVKDIAIKLANKTILNPENVKDKQLKNKVVNRGVLRGFKEIVNTILSGDINFEEAKGWYNDEINDTMDILKEEFPQMKDDESLEVFAKSVLAITSNGQNVRANYNNAVGLIQSYLETGSFEQGLHVTDEYDKDRKKTGKFLEKPAMFYTDIYGEKKVVGGVRFGQIRDHLMILEQIIDKFGMSGGMRFLLEKRTGREISETVGKGGLKLTFDHYGAERFGDKLGAFFLNMNGISELPTYDLWWTRTYNRWMGTPLNNAGNLVQSPRNDSERAVMTDILNKLSDKLTNDKDLNPSGERINPEDIQALLWYMEKDLYIKSGASPSELISFKTVAQERRSLINERDKSTSSESLQESNEIEGVGNIRTGETGEVSSDTKREIERTREDIRKGNSYQIKAFHGTDIPTIKEFDPFSKARTGRQQGFGIYFGDERGLAVHYAKQVFKSRQDFERGDLNKDGSQKFKPTVYDVVVHKGKTPEQYDYLNWEDSPTKEQEQKIMAQASKEFTEEEQEQLLNLYMSKLTGEMQPYQSILYYHKLDMGTVGMSDNGVWINQDIYDAIAGIFLKRMQNEGVENINQQTIYNEVYYKASMFLLDAGIDGARFTSAVSPPGVKGMNKGIVVFDASEIDIQKKESFRIKSVKNRLELKPETVKDWLYQKIVDKYHRMKIVQQSFPVVGEDVDVYLKLVQHPGQTKYRLEQVEKQVEKIITRLDKAGFTLEQFEEYLYALHVHSRNKVIRKRTNGENDAGSGMTDKEASDILEKYTGSRMDAIVKTWHKQITGKRLDLLRKHGFITKAEYDAYYKQWDNYVPLKSDTLLNRFFQNVRSGFNVQGKDVHRAGGRTTRARNVVFQSVADLQETIRRVEQNKVLKTVAKLVRQNPSDLWKIKRPKTHAKRRLWDEDGNYEIFGQDPLAENEIGFIEIDKDGNRKQMVIEINDKSSVVKDKFGRVQRNPLLVTLSNIGVEKGFSILNKINNHLRRVYTTYSPDFIVSNFERDLQTAFYNLNTDYDPKTAISIMNDVRKALVGIYKNVRGHKKAGLFGNEWKNLYEDYKRNGGQMGWFDSKSIDETIKNIENNIKNSANKGKTRKAISYMAQYIEHLNETVESAVRLATYKNMIKNGMSKRKAVSIAKDLTINFNRKGEWGSMINSAYLFFNAGVQGAVNVGSRAFGTKTGRGIAGSLFGLGMLNSFINKQICPEYDTKISGYEKDNYMIFMKPGCDMGFKLRMPYGWGMFKAMGGISYDYMDGSIKLTEATTRLFSSADHSFNPMGGGTVLQAVSPTIVDPLVMIGEGKDFKGDDLYPKEYSPNKTPDYTKHKKYTSDLYVKGAKWIAEGTGVDVSPETYKVWVNFLGGGALSNIANSFTTGSNLISEGRLPRVRNDENTINWSVIPIFRQHITQPKDYVVANKVYDMLRNADVQLYDPEKFKYYLQQAVRNGSIDSEKAYGKYGWDADNDGWIDTGTTGLQKQFMERQGELYQKGGKY